MGRRPGTRRGWGRGCCPGGRTGAARWTPATIHSTPTGHLLAVPAGGGPARGRLVGVGRPGLDNQKPAGRRDATPEVTPAAGPRDTAITTADAPDHLVARPG